MKEVKGSHGETELQAPEHVSHGPIQVADRLAMIDVLRRIDILEAQVKSLQMTATKGIPG
jgi:hypothetical protein